MIDRKAELALIGCLIQDPRSHKVMTGITAQDFSDPALRDAYVTIERMVAQKRPFDMVILDQETGGGITTTLLDAIASAPTSVLAGQYAASIKEQSVRRRVSALASALYREMGDRSVDVQASLASVRQALDDLGVGIRSEWQSATDLAASTLQWLERLHSGQEKPVQSGVADMDRLIGGFYPGELTVVGAKPGTGKTVFGMVVGLNAARDGRKVGILNLEMLSSQYGTRMVSNIGRVDAMKLRRGDFTGDDWRTIGDACAEIAMLPATFMFATRYIEDLISAVKAADIDLLVVDYIQLVRTKQVLESERLRMAHISWALKELAVDRQIPVIAMSQLRRPDASASDKMPSMRDLRESGNLEADADGIILLHEPASGGDPYVYPADKQNWDAWRKQGLRYICMKVEKQRQGAVGTVPVLFDARHMRYLGIERGTT